MSPTVVAALLPGAVLTPLVVAAGLVWPRARPVLLRAAPWAAVPALAASLLVPQGQPIVLSWVVLGATLGLDQIGQVFLFFTALLWWLAGVYAQVYLGGDVRVARFVVFYLLAMSGNIALVIAADAVTFYAGFSVMGIAAYGLVVHDGTRAALDAGRVYIALVVVGEVAVFTALVLLATSAESLQLRDIAAHPQSAVAMALLLVGFGIKAGALPLHVWLPLAHPAAPVPASAVLSGAMIKAGLLGWVRFLPLGHALHPTWGALVLAAGLIAALGAALVGVTQRNPKTVLAYSSISQMGLMTVPIGTALLVPALWPAAATAISVYALHHALAKGALFLGVGAAAHAATPAQHHAVLAGLLLPALALAGAPYTTGLFAKAALKADVYGLPPAWSAITEPALAAAAVGTTLLMVRFLWLLRPPSSTHESRRVAAGLWLAWAAVLCVVGGIAWIGPFAVIMRPAALAVPPAWSVIWPICAGGLIAGLAWRLGRRDPSLALPEIPAGDLLWPVRFAVRGATRWARMVRRRRRAPSWQPGLDRWGALPDVSTHAAWLERVARTWVVAGVTGLALTLLLYAALRS